MVGGMNRIGAALHSATFHLVMSYLWMFMIIPTLLWWKSSILWVAAMSLYANFIGHWSAYQAARAERKADEVRED